MGAADLPHALGELSSVRKITEGGLGVELRAGRAALIVRPLTDTAVKISLRFNAPRLNLALSERPYALLPGPWPGAPLEVTEDDTAVSIRAGRLRLRAERSPLRLSYALDDTEPFLREIAGGGVRADYWDVALNFDLPADEAFYGLGQADQHGPEDQLGPDRPARSAVPLNHRGLHLPIWHWHQAPSRVIEPMLLSSRRYGLLIDNPYKAAWDLGVADPTRFSYTAAGGRMDLIVFAGDSLLDLIRAYTGLTGRIPMPPLWALGYLQSRYGYRDEAELLALADRLRAADIPCDGLVLDLHWFDQMGDLTFAPSRWPAPAAMIQKLTAAGFHVTLIEEPYLTEHSRLYPEALQRGFLGRRPDGRPYLHDNWIGRTALLDVTNHEARRWWAVQHAPLVEMGVEGHWLDLTEPMDHPIDMLHAEGPAIACHNRFADQMVDSVLSAWQEHAPDRRPFLMTRAGFAGMQRTGAALWSGDVDVSWEALATQVALGQNAGLAGFALWNSDIGGFSRKGLGPDDLAFSERFQAPMDRPEDPELYVRWLQFGVFSPICRVHSDQYRRREPWVFGPDVEAIARHYLRLRYRLLPYIYSLCYQAHTTGAPIMRPLILHYEDDPVAPTLTDEYLFGPDILVAPVLAPGARRRRLYLPAGVWYDGWDETRYTGPAWIEVAAPLDQLPIFIRAGSIIPFGPRRTFSGQRPLDPLTLNCYVGAAGHFDLYEDDGATLGYRRGDYCLTPLDVAEQDGVLQMTIGACQGRHAGAPHERLLLLWLHGIPDISAIHRDERPLPALASRDAWRKVKAGWWHDADRALVGVKVQPTAGPIALHVHGKKASRARREE
jgi:alpha-glucosidase (family GH31 glycosyl hydrolase)